MAHITKEQHAIVFANDTVPVLDECLIHFVNVTMRPVTVLDDIVVP